MKLGVQLGCGLGLVALGILLYLSSQHAAIGNSDGATVILEGKALAGGNFTLDHWALSLDSFWLVDVLLYAVAVAIGGVHPQLLHMVPVIAAAGVIVAGAWTARLGRRGWASVLAAGAVVVFLGFPTHAFAEFFLMGPLHVATTLWCLLAAIALRRLRFGWGFVLAVVLLAAGMLGDLQAAVLGVVPVFCAGVVTVLRQRNVRSGAPALGAAIGSVVLAGAVHLLAKVIGSFTIAAANPRAPFHQMLQNVTHVLSYGAALEGAGYQPFGSESIPTVLEVAHGVGLGVIVLAILWALVSLVWSSVMGDRSAEGEPLSPDATPPAVAPETARAEAFLQDYLLFGFFGGCVVYVWLSLSSAGAFGRYLTPALIFGTILAGRLVGKVAERIRSLALRGVVTVAAVLVSVGYLATFTSTLTTAAPYQPAVELTSYLTEHHLTRGIGDYWSASIVTVESSDAISVRPVVERPGGRLGRYMRQSTSTWYGGGFQFLVYRATVPWGGVDATSAAASFGTPKSIVAVGPYRVLTWSHDLAVRRDGT